MKANELRIGNYVYFHGDVEEINMVDGCGVIGREEQPLCSIDEFTPIPLTEEWLLKFGFERIENNWKCLNLGFATISWERLAGLTFTLENESIFIPHIQYVHQIQNLYSALTGEEIVIKE